MHKNNTVFWRFGDSSDTVFEELDETKLGKYTILPKKG